jgi:hypothetical protein
LPKASRGYNLEKEFEVALNGLLGYRFTFIGMGGSDENNGI